MAIANPSDTSYCRSRVCMSGARPHGHRANTAFAAHVQEAATAFGGDRARPFRVLGVTAVIGDPCVGVDASPGARATRCFLSPYRRRSCCKPTARESCRMPRQLV